MLIKDEDFRNLFLSYIVIKDEEVAKDIAKNFYIDEIFEDDIDSDELSKRFKIFESI